MSKIVFERFSLFDIFIQIELRHVPEYEEISVNAHIIKLIIKHEVSFNFRTLHALCRTR